MLAAVLAVQLLIGSATSDAKFTQKVKQASTSSSSQPGIVEADASCQASSLVQRSFRSTKVDVEKATASSSAMRPGLWAEFFEMDVCQMPDFAQHLHTVFLSLPQPRIYYPKLESFPFSNFSIDKHFAARFTGYLEITLEGTYMFQTTSDDGSMMYIDGTLVVDNDGCHGVRTRSGEIYLTHGRHAVVVEYFENDDGEAMLWEYSGPDTCSVRILVPERVLWHSRHGSYYYYYYYYQHTDYYFDTLLQLSDANAITTGSNSVQQEAAATNRGFEMRSDDIAKTAIPPRQELWNVREPLETLSAPGMPLGTDEHNQCNANTPDGRLYFCGEDHKAVRYFKFESMEFTQAGVPHITDATWSLWPHMVDVDNPKVVTWCVPEWKKPFEVLCDGSHLYRLYVFARTKRWSLTVIVSNPMTPHAEITEVLVGPRETFTTGLPRYAAFATDGKLIVGSQAHPTDRTATYSALPEDGEPCSMDWPAMRPLRDLPLDLDGLNLPGRYPFAQHQFRNGLGTPFSADMEIVGAYMWFDNDARNLWYGAGRHWRVMGKDTSGIELILQGGIVMDEDESDTWMSSPLWNFESERTANSRYPGELHTSGVGSGCTYQLPMSKASHVLPVFTAHQQFYTETELFNVWKSPHWDIFYLPMGQTYTSRSTTSEDKVAADQTPDLSRHFLHGLMVGDAEVDWDGAIGPLGTTQGVGAAVQVHTAGAVIVDFTGVENVPAVDSPVRAFTAQLSFLTEWKVNTGFRWLMQHPNISIEFGKSTKVKWDFMGMKVVGGTYDKNQWVHLALVFDGVDQTVTTYNNGVEVTTMPTTFNTFQLGSEPVVLGNRFWYTGGKGLKGRIDNVRFMSHARSQRDICKSAFGSSCTDAISYHPTSSQFELGMQLKECTAATMHTIACYAAIHRVCANIDAMLMKDSGTSNNALNALTPPGPPVSMGGVPVALYSDSVAVACTPNDNHLSVPVDWRVMEKYNSGCTAMTDHSSDAIHCNLAAYGFCKEAFTSIDVTKATGVVFETDARAWVTCFEATRVIEDSIASCSSSIESLGCQIEAASRCDSEDGGLVQQLIDGVVSIHCFNAPPHLGLHNFAL